MKPAQFPFSVHQCLLGLVGEVFAELHFSPAVLSVPYLTYSLQFSPNPTCFLKERKLRSYEAIQNLQSLAVGIGPALSFRNVSDCSHFKPSSRFTGTNLLVFFICHHASFLLSLLKPKYVCQLQFAKHF